MRTARVLSLAAILCLQLRMSWAGEAEKARAEALFQEAQMLMEQKRYEEACPKLSSSQKLDPAIGTLLNLALCLERLGKTASAWADYEEAAGMARKASDRERERYAHDHAVALSKRVAFISVHAPNAPRDLSVLLDGMQLEPAEYSRIPVDPGAHRVEAKASARKPWSTTVNVIEGSSSELTIPELDEDRPVSSATTSSAVMETPKRSNSLGPALKIAAISSWSLAAVGVGIGIGLAVSATNQDTESLKHCLPNDPTLCNAMGVSLRKTAGDLASGATAAFVISGVIALSGLAMWFFAPPSSTASTSLRVTPTGIVLGGEW